MAAVATMPGLRPLGFGEILDVGIKLYLKNWRPLILCVVGLVLPVQIITVLLLLSVAPDLLDPTETSPRLDSDDGDALLAAQGVSALLQMLVYVIATAACFKAVSDAYLGAEPSAKRSLAFAVKALPKFLLLGLLYVVVLGAIFGGLALAGPVALGIGILVLIVPLIYLSVAWSLTIPAMLFERTMPWTALQRSFRLVKGRWWPICGVIIVGVMLVSFLAGILQAVIQLVPAFLADGNEAVLAFSTVVAGTVGSALTTPYTAAVIALLYFDQRVRKEGFDLEILAQGLGERYDPGAVPPPAYVAREVTPEQRAAAPFWPPPPGWTPPEPEPTSTAGWAHPTTPEEPPREAPPPADEAPPPDEPDRPWEPPRSPSWPPETPPRGSGGL